MTHERIILWTLLAATFAIRAIHPGQPIVENYVGRQIPTAMVARNLEWGSGFLHPQLDTGPFPNLFLVEPPIYAQVVIWVRPVFGFDREATGRLVSAAATTLAAWGLFGLVQRRDGPLVALLALGSFGMFPVMIRYGRAFQPDALMLGCILAGLRIWDEYEEWGNWRRAAFGGFVLSIGLALKITTAWALIPFVLIVRRWPISHRIAAATAMLIPAAAWYLLVWEQVARPGPGSLASFDNANLWLGSVSLTNWLRFSTIEIIARRLVLGSFTPIGFVLACWGGLVWSRHNQARPPVGQDGPDRLWIGWGVGCLVSMIGLASKWHHAYYWMVVAPLVAVGMARGLVGLVRLRKFGKLVGSILGSFFLAACVWQSASTWRTPNEWASLIEVAGTVASLTTEDQLVVAPEAFLYYCGRRGYRLEFAPEAARRAVGEWGHPLFTDPQTPLALTESYWTLHSLQMARSRLLAKPQIFDWSNTDYLLAVDVGPEELDSGRRAWRASLRARPKTKIFLDRPDAIIAELH